MAQPPLTVTAQRLYDGLEPLATEDEQNGWALAYFCAALLTMLDDVVEVSRDQDDGTPGHAILFDPDLAPAKWLPWMAQFVGVTVLENLAEDSQRLRIKETDGRKRGTPDAIRGAARQHLTGAGYVALIERDGDAYTFTVITRTSETPLDPVATWEDAEIPWDAGSGTWDSADSLPIAVWRALVEQKPGGLRMNFVVAPGETWNEAAASWNSVGATLTWNDTLNTTI